MGRFSSCGSQGPDVAIAELMAPPPFFLVTVSQIGRHVDVGPRHRLIACDCAQPVRFDGVA